MSGTPYRYASIGDNDLMTNLKRDDVIGLRESVGRTRVSNITIEVRIGSVRYKLCIGKEKRFKQTFFRWCNVRGGEICRPSNIIESYNLASFGVTLIKKHYTKRQIVLLESK